MSTNSTQISVTPAGKNMLVAYIIWFFLGGLGIHRFYLGRMKTGVAMLALSVVGALTVLFYIGILLLMIVGVWWLADAYFTQAIVTQENEKLGIQSSSITLHTVSTGQKSEDSALDQLSKLADLKDRGVINETEFEAKKAQLMQS